MKIAKIVKFSKYAVFTYYDPCDPKFSSVSLYLQLGFFAKFLSCLANILVAISKI